MGRTNSEILKDRRFFSAEQEEAIHKAAAEEIKKYTLRQRIMKIQPLIIYGMLQKQCSEGSS